MPRRKQDENLIPFSKRSKKEAREKGRKGGIASGKARREKADLRKQMQLFLETDATTDKNGNPLTGAELMVKVAVKEMTKGNSKYWELIRDTAGFKPVDKVMVAEVDQDIVNQVEQMVLGAEDDDEEDEA